MDSTLTQCFNIHGIATDKMHNPPGYLWWASFLIGAIMNRFPLFPNQHSAAGRAMLYILKRLLCGIPFGEVHASNFRNDISTFFYGYRIAGPQVQPLYFV